MNAEEKTAWIDEENKIVSFHAIDNAKMVMKAESLFWDFLPVQKENPPVRPRAGQNYSGNDRGLYADQA